jgi:ketosteroid isomerase-like protein
LRCSSGSCEYDIGVNPLQAYIDGWRRHDISAVLGTLADDCVVTECYGPIYRGRTRVEQWMTTWLAIGSVDSWEITNQIATGDVLVAEWTFSCTYRGDSATFDGATIARLRDGEITYLREYATTAQLYEWTGSWRE